MAIPLKRNKDYNVAKRVVQIEIEIFRRISSSAAEWLEKINGLVPLRPARTIHINSSE